jgi:hypothetical protein
VLASAAAEATVALGCRAGHRLRSGFQLRGSRGQPRDQNPDLAFEAVGHLVEGGFLLGGALQLDRFLLGPQAAGFDQVGFEHQDCTGHDADFVTPAGAGHVDFKMVLRQMIHSLFKTQNRPADIPADQPADQQRDEHNRARCHPQMA